MAQAPAPRIWSAKARLTPFGQPFVPVAAVPTLPTFNVETYGAVHDAVALNGAGTVAASSTAFSNAGASFVVGDVGKVIAIQGAGAGGVPLVTTIAARGSSTTLTLTAAASTSVTTANVVYGTNDAPSVQSAITACVAAGANEVYMPNGFYLFDTYRAINADMAAGVELMTGTHIVGQSRAGVTIFNTYLNQNAFGASQRHDVSVSYVTGYQVSPAQGDFIKFYDCDNAQVNQVTAHDGYIGIAFYDCTNSAITNSLAYNMSDCGIQISTGVLDFGTPGFATSVVSCEAYGCAYGFQTSGQDLLSGDPRRYSNPVLTNCYGHNNSDGILASYCSNLVVTNFTGGNNSVHDIYLGGVATATLSGSYSHPAYQLIDADNHTAYTHWGPCSNITET